LGLSGFFAYRIERFEASVAKQAACETQHHYLWILDPGLVVMDGVLRDAKCATPGGRSKALEANQAVLRAPQLRLWSPAARG